MRGIREHEGYKEEKRCIRITRGTEAEQAGENENNRDTRTCGMQGERGKYEDKGISEENTRTAGE